MTSRNSSECDKFKFDITKMADTFDLPPDEPAWFGKVLERLLQGINEAVTNLLTPLQKSLMESALQAEKNSEKIRMLSMENSELRREVSIIKNRLISIESQARRDNLIIAGITESHKETWTDCERKVYDVLKHKLKIHNAEEIKFERVHRIGPFIQGKTRNIIAKFSTYKDRDIVWQKRTFLKGSDLWILEDYPSEVQQNRRTLYPALREALKLMKKPGSEIKKASMSVDSLIINGKKYTVSDMDKLPPSIRPENISTITKDDTTVFFSKNSILSNFYTSAPIIIQGEKYNCTEQFYQKSKAEHFQDDVTAAAIMRSVDPAEQYRLGKKVKRYSDHEWMKRAKQVLSVANMAKFQQNDHAKRVLLGTGSNTLGEASASKIWGIGLKLNDQNVTDTSLWSGENIMGKVLTEIRNELKKKL